MTIQEFEKLIEKHDLTECKEMLMSWFRPAIDILPYRGDVKLGQSHFGGAPHLPPETTWPTYKDVPYIFVGQINFEELPNVEILPKTGLLSIFVMHYGYSPRLAELDWHGHEGYAHLIYTPDTKALEPLDIPDNTPLSPSAPIKFSLTGDIVAPNGLFNFDFDEEEQEWAIEDFRRILHPGIKSPRDFSEKHEIYYNALEGKRHQLMGYFESCQIDDIDPGPDGYIPFITLDTCKFFGWSWADGDMMCISMEKDKLKQADFNSFHVHQD